MYAVILTHYSDDEFKKSKMAMACGTYGEKRVAYTVLLWRHKGRLSLGISRHRWDGNIKMGLQEISSESMDWNDVAQSWSLVHVVMKCGEYLG